MLLNIHGDHLTTTLDANLDATTTKRQQMLVDMTELLAGIVPADPDAIERTPEEKQAYERYKDIADGIFY